MAEVRVLGALRRLTGAARFAAPGPSVAEVLDATAARGGPALAKLLFGESPEEAPAARTLHPDLRVLVNGRSVLFLDGLATAVEDRDTVTLHFTGARGFPGG